MMGIVRVIKESPISQRTFVNTTGVLLTEEDRLSQSPVTHETDYAVFMLDVDGRIATWNNGAAYVTGYNAGEIAGKHFSILFKENKLRDSQVQHILSMANQHGHAEDESEFTSKDGQHYWGRTTVTLLQLGDDGVTGFSVTLKDLKENRKREQALANREVELHELAEHLEVTRESERVRVARELHDEFGQMLTAFRIDLTILNRMISKTVDPVKRISLLEKISQTSQLVESTIKSTQRMITELRPAVLDELGLPTAILWQAQEFEDRTGIQCRVNTLQRTMALGERSSTAIFRIFQEALTNIARHSKATHVAVSAMTTGDFFILKVTDDGIGIDESRLRNRGSFGLLRIRERVAALGGRFEIDTLQGEGTTLTVSIPCTNG